MSFVTTVRTALANNGKALGFWLTLPSAAVAKTILRPAQGRFQWVLIDAEHGLISDRDYYDLTNAIASEGASPLIRVPWSEEWMIKRALDAGAHGIVTPMCHNADDAARIVKYSKYPPLGTRGYGPMFAPHALPGVLPGVQYDDGSEQGLIVVVQIESRSGLENVEAIAATEGVDVIFIGPFDLAKQNNIVRGGEEHEAAIQRILAAAHKHGKKAAIFCTDGAQAKLRSEQGFDMISVATDVGVLAEGMLKELAVAENGTSITVAARSGY